MRLSIHKAYIITGEGSGLSSFRGHTTRKIFYAVDICGEEEVEHLSAILIIILMIMALAIGVVLFRGVELVTSSVIPYLLGVRRRGYSGVSNYALL